MQFKNAFNITNEAQVPIVNTVISDSVNDVTQFVASNTSSDNGTLNNYDSVGAMHFIVAVILIYGFAVMGVFIMSFLQRSRSSHKDIDTQANYFFKDINVVRNRLTRSDRLQSVNKFMGEIGIPPKSESGTKAVGAGLLSYMALPIIINSTDHVKQNGCPEAINSQISSSDKKNIKASIKQTERSEYV